MMRTAILGCLLAAACHIAAAASNRHLQANGGGAAVAFSSQISASNSATGDLFGWASAMDGNGTVALVGAYGKTVGSNVLQGSAYVFARPPGLNPWSQTAELRASDGAANDTFGISLSINSDGTMALVGACGARVGAAVGQGVVYAFSREDASRSGRRNTSASWVQTQRLVSSDGAAGDTFGYDVAIASGSGTALVAVVGAWGKATRRGAAYVFVRTGTVGTGVWTEVARLTAADAFAGDLFGASVAITASGSRIIVGAVSKLVSGVLGAGAAYVFDATDASMRTWTQTTRLTAGVPSRGAQFGVSVTLSESGQQAMVGAYLQTTAAVPQAGAAYAFTCNATRCTQSAFLFAPNPSFGDVFGYPVVLDRTGTIAYVGAFERSFVTGPNRGSVLIFQRTGQTWILAAELAATDGMYGDAFGISISISADATAVIIGAERKSVTAVAQGVAYMADIRFSSPSVTVSPSASVAATRSASVSGTMTPTPSQTASRSVTSTASRSATTSSSMSVSCTPTRSASGSRSPSVLASTSTSATVSISASASVYASLSITGTPASSLSSSSSVTTSATASASMSLSQTLSGTTSASPSTQISATGSMSVSASASTSPEVSTSSSGTVSSSPAASLSAAASSSSTAAASSTRSSSSMTGALSPSSGGTGAATSSTGTASAFALTASASASAAAASPQAASVSASPSVSLAYPPSLPPVADTPSSTAAGTPTAVTSVTASVSPLSGGLNVSLGELQAGAAARGSSTSSGPNSDTAVITIVGAVAGVVAACIIVSVVVLLLARRRKRAMRGVAATHRLGVPERENNASTRKVAARGEVDIVAWRVSSQRPGERRVGHAPVPTTSAVASGTPAQLQGMYGGTAIAPSRATPVFRSSTEGTAVRVKAAAKAAAAAVPAYQHIRSPPSRASAPTTSAVNAFTAARQAASRGASRRGSGTGVGSVGMTSTIKSTRAIISHTEADAEEGRDAEMVGSAVSALPRRPSSMRISMDPTTVRPGDDMSRDPRGGSSRWWA